MGGGCWLVHFYHSLQAVGTRLSRGRPTALNSIVLSVISRQWGPARKAPPRDCRDPQRSLSLVSFYGRGWGWGWEWERSSPCHRTQGTAAFACKHSHLKSHGRSTRATGVCGISETVNGALYELTEFFSTFRKAYEFCSSLVAVQAGVWRVFLIMAQHC